MAKNRTSRKAPRAPEWGIAVRLAGGDLRYYCHDHRGRSVQPHWGEMPYALRFDTAEAAWAVASTFETMGRVASYEVVRLPWAPSDANGPR